jgi:DNA polymerase elongation subunit (family B)
MAISCGRDGVLSDNIEKKGVLLARRDNSKFVRDLYQNIIMMIFDGKNKEDTLYFITKYISDLCSGKFGYKEFIITKLVGDIADYKVKDLPEDFKKRTKRLMDLDINMHPTFNIHNPENCRICKQEYELYKIKCLPAHIQLSEKMRQRGNNVEAGSRIEYLVSVGSGHLSKQYDKLEDPKYQQMYKDIVKIDYLHYLKTSCPPIDQILSVGFGEDNFMKKQYKQRLIKSDFENSIKNYENDIVNIHDRLNNKELFIVDYKQSNLKFIE